MRPVDVEQRTAPALEVEALGKRYGGVVALDNVSFEVARGDVLGVVGPNGAGKSTLLKTISGEIRADTGSVRVDGTEIDTLRRHQIARHGIAIAHQIPRPFGQLTVRDNVRVGTLRTRGDGINVDEILAETGLAHRAFVPAASLALIDRKKLELARALSLRPQLLLLDEVAAGLVDHEVEEILHLMEGIRARGVTLVVVEHVQRVIGELATNVVVLDWGRVVASGTPTSVAADPTVKSIYLGSSAVTRRSSVPHRRPAKEPLLKLDDVSADWGGARALDSVSLTVEPGEVVALLGANGAGKSTLAQVVAGDKRPGSGRVWFSGEDVSSVPPHRRVSAGIVHAPEGRHVFGELTVAQNLMLGGYARRARTRSADQAKFVREIFPELSERSRQLAGTLSGGQQQMLAIARGLMSSPRLLVLDEVSLGLAPVMTDRVYESLRAIVDTGVALLLIEQNVDRSLALCDRAYMLSRGRLTFAGSPEELEDETLLHDAYFGSTGHQSATRADQSHMEEQ